MASLLLMAWFWGSKHRIPKLTPRDSGLLVALAMTGFTGYHVALNLGEQTVGAGVASLLITTVPVWTAVLAALFLGEQLGRRGWAGMWLAFVGAGIVALSGSGDTSFGLGATWILLAAVLQAIYFTLQKRLLDRFDPLVLTSLAIWLGTASLLPALPRLGREIAAASSETIIATIYLGVFPTALAYLVWAWALARRPASQLASWLFLVPIVSFLLGWLVLAEVPTAGAVGGGLVTLCGIWLMQHRSSASPTASITVKA